MKKDILALCALLALYSPMKADPVRITAVGDVTLGYHFNNVFAKLESDSGEAKAIAYPFSRVKQYFESSVTIANLEGTLTQNDKKTPKKFNFKGNLEYALCLKQASIEIANLANNHSFDYGSRGLEETFDALDKNGISYCGAGKNIEEARKPKIIEEQGLKIAFLGYADVGKDFRATDESCGVAPCLDDYVSEDVRKAKQTADIVVVSFHFGEERMKHPTRRQKEIARKAIDSGADIVLGHHPHILQGIERYKKGIIFYSLGNFCFGGNDNPKDKDSIIASIQVSKAGIDTFYVVPVKIASENNFQPYPVEGQERERIMKKITSRSR